MPRVDTTQVVCVAEFHAVEGKADELIEALHRLIPPTVAESGCLRYELNQRRDEPRWITFIEKWKDKQAFDAHCAMPYITDYFERVRPRLVEEYSVRLYNEIVS